MTENLTLKINHIAKSFGEMQILSDVSFEVNSGKITVLMGTNGSGKTTLLNIISGFLKQDAGEIFLRGEKITKTQTFQISRLGITRTFQDMRLIGNLTVLENVLLAFPVQQGEKWWNVLITKKIVKKEQQANAKQAEKILENCFINDVADCNANAISYGQQKLLNLACCIANDAEVFLLDEPVAGVNPIYIDKLVTVIQQLKKQGKAVLIIEHNTDFIEAITDEIIFLNEGTVTKFDNYSTLKNNEAVQNAYI